MTSCYGSVCLLVLLGVVLAFGSPVQLDTLTRTHTSISDLLQLKEPEVGSKPLFSSVIENIRTSCQRKEQIQLINATLDIYMHIFSSILEHHQNHGKTGSSLLLDQLTQPMRSQVELDLMKLQQEMEEVRRHLGHLDHQKHNQKNVDDPLDQRKALAEFREVYRAACVVASRDCGFTH
uniref:Uncharacterized protein n=1 Tax=Mastacembelus armatus TaxID=205130 RepID=A0A3Q3N7Y3_9TELE